MVDIKTLDEILRYMDEHNIDVKVYEFPGKIIIHVVSKHSWWFWKFKMPNILHTLTCIVPVCIQLVFVRGIKVY